MTVDWIHPSDEVKKTSFFLKNYIQINEMKQRETYVCYIIFFRQNIDLREDYFISLNSPSTTDENICSMRKITIIIKI